MTRQGQLDGPKPEAERSHTLAGTRPYAVVGSVFLGAASGLRAQLGVATVVVRSDHSLPPIFRQPWTRRLLVAAAAGELVVDKLPAAPSRLTPPGIAARLAMGALAAGLFAQTRQAHWLPAAAIGASSAVIAAKFGHDVRARLAHHAPDPAIAVVEDALGLGLAAAGALSIQLSLRYSTDDRIGAVRHAPRSRRRPRFLTGHRRGGDPARRPSRWHQRG